MRRGGVLVLAVALVAAALAAPTTAGAGGGSSCGPGNEAKASGALKAPPREFRTVKDGAQRVTAATGGITVTVTKDPLSISMKTRRGDLVREIDEGGLYFRRGETDPVPIARATGVDADECAVRVDVTFTDATEGVVVVRAHARDTVSVTLELPDAEDVTAWGETLVTPADERIYGLTERIVDDVGASEITPQAVGSLDRKGETVTMYVQPTISAYVPFYQASTGYGLLVDGTMPGRYDIAQSVPDQLRFEFELDPDARAGRYFVFAGETHYDLNDAFSRLAGRPLLPPPKVFLHWRGRDEAVKGPPVTVDGVPMNPTVADDLLHYEEYGIAVGIYHFDRPWAIGTEGYGDFVFDPERFPDPAGMLRAMKKEGWQSQVWISEWALDDRQAEAARNDWLASESPREIDLTDPDAVEWLEDDLTTFLAGPEGRFIDGFFLDRTEEIVPSTRADTYADGRDGRQIHNAYPVLMQAIAHDAITAERGDDGWVIARAAYTGTPRYALTWGGDTHSREGLILPEAPNVGPSTDLGLRSVLISNQRAAFMGLPYIGSDIGGYSEFADREVFARWIEVGAASPLMRFHGKGTKAPWDMPTEPTFDAEVLDIYRRYVELHHALQDYLVARSEEAHETGAPIVRPLVYNYPDDDRVGDLWDEWLLGDDILVAPVWQSGARSRSVYLPEGTWVDFWDRDRVLEGPVDLTEDVPLGELPMFVRQGSPVLEISPP